MYNKFTIILILIVIKVNTDYVLYYGRYILFESDTPDLERLAFSHHFIDKTGFIKEFFQGPPFIMITAPRRFGKSASVDMVKRFAGLEVDKKGKIKKKEDYKNYKLFEKYNFKVFQDKKFFDDHFGKYPIIHLKFKKLISHNFEYFYHSFKNLVMKTFKSHSYLKKSKKLDEYNKNNYSILTNEKRIDRASMDDIAYSINTLSEFVYKHYNRKLILLIDDIETAVTECITFGDEIDKIFAFLIKFLFGTIRDNQYVERALITSRVRYTGFMSKVTKVETMPFLKDHPYSGYFGLTEVEAESIMKRFNKSDSMPDVKYYSGGYHHATTGQVFFNTYSIVACLKKRRVRKFWSPSAGIRHYKKMLGVKEVCNKVEKLLVDFTGKRKGVKIKYMEGFLVAELMRFKRIVKKKIKVRHYDVDRFLHYLTESGYFTALGKEGDFIRIRIPNVEAAGELFLRCKRRLHKSESKMLKKYFKDNLVPKKFYKRKKNDYLDSIATDDLV